MPIIMDRHYHKDATQRALAAAHQSDLRLQDKYNVKMLTYWFDEDRGTAFCLVDAPDEESIHLLHDEAHGAIPNEIIAVDPTAVEAFLGRIDDPVPADKISPNSTEATVDAAFRTIMYTDLQDSTLMTARLGDTKAVQLLRVHNSIIRRELKLFDGREVKHTGDGFMASFGSATNAVHCSIEIQRAFESYNGKNQEASMRIRIGMSAGEPVEENGDLFGASVRLSARLCQHANPDSIIAAQVVRDECARGKFSFKDKGGLMPKGFLKSIQIYEVIWSAK